MREWLQILDWLMKTAKTMVREEYEAFTEALVDNAYLDASVEKSSQKVSLS